MGKATKITSVMLALSMCLGMLPAAAFAAEGNPAAEPGASIAEAVNPEETKDAAEADRPENAGVTEEIEKPEKVEETTEDEGSAKGPDSETSEGDTGSEGFEESVTPQEIGGNTEIEEPAETTEPEVPEETTKTEGTGDPAASQGDNEELGTPEDGADPEPPQEPVENEKTGNADGIGTTGIETDELHPNFFQEQTEPMLAACMKANVQALSLNIEHVEEPVTPNPDDSSSAKVEVRTEAGDDEGFAEVTAFIYDKELYKDNKGWSAGLSRYISTSALPEEKKVGETCPLPTPVTETLEDGTTVTWTRVKWESDGKWHMDGAVVDNNTAPNKISVSDNSAEFGSAVGIKGINWGTETYWYDLNTDEIAAILDEVTYGLPQPADSGIIAPPAVSSALKAKLNEYLEGLGWTAGDDAIEWKYKYEPQDNSWHLDGELKHQSKDVSIVVSDPTGQFNEASGEKLTATNESQKDGTYWHNVATGKFILPDPAKYKEGDVYIPSESQMKQIQELVNEQQGWASVDGDKDGTIQWQFVRKGSDDNAQWDLEGTYIPNYLNVYVYVVGDKNKFDQARIHGNNCPVADDATSQKGDEVWNDSWYTTGKLKIDLDTLGIDRAVLSDLLRGEHKYFNDTAGELQEKLYQTVMQQLYENDLIFKGNDEFWSRALKEVNWFGLKPEVGADDYVSGGYYTLHLDGRLVNVPIDPDPVPPEPVDPDPVPPGPVDPDPVPPGPVDPDPVPPGPVDPDPVPPGPVDPDPVPPGPNNPDPDDPKPDHDPVPNPGPGPIPEDPDDNNDPTPQPTPSTPSGKKPLVDIPTQDIPLSENPVVDIPDTDTPLAEPPALDISKEDIPSAVEPEFETPESEITLTDIPEENIPLADVPQTGDINPAFWYMAMVLSALGLVILAVKKKGKEQ